MSTTAGFDLTRNPFGRLVFTAADGTLHEGVTPVHAFPVSAPQEGVALVSSDGHELAWIGHLDDLPDAIGRLIREELESREFIPEIRSIRDVSSFATPSTWQVETDRGDTAFTLRSEDEIRRLNSSTLLISDSHGIHFLVRDIHALDRHSRKLMDRFL